MKSKMFFKKAVSIMMSAMVSASTIFPVYAANTIESAGTLEKDVEAESAETNLEEANIEATSETQAYMLILPKAEGTEYTYANEYKDSSLSVEAYDVLLFSENAEVKVSINTDRELQLVDAATEEVFLSNEQFEDGNLEFNMPAKDLILEEVPSETEAATETETTTAETSESETEEVVETEEFSEDEPGTEEVAETESEVQKETESETPKEHFLEPEEDVNGLDISTQLSKDSPASKR